MNTLMINKRFSSRAEMEAYEEKLNEKYFIVMIIRMPQDVIGPEVYGIESIIYVGERA